MLKRIVGRVPRWVDVGFPALLGLFLAAIVVDGDRRGYQGWGGLLAGVGAAVALYGRRRHPERVLAVTVALGGVTQFVVPEQLFPYPALVALWALTARRSVVRSLAGLGAVIGVTLLVLPSYPYARADVEFACAVAGLVWALAFALRSHRQAIEQAGARFAMEEQARLARDIHDVIAHSVSVIVVQAAAADDVFDVRPDRARPALRSIEATGRDALAELRRLLAPPSTASSSDNRLKPAGVNRTTRKPFGPNATQPQTSLTPQPTLDRLRPDVLAPLAAAGLHTDLTLDGEALGLAAGLQLTAFRIVQESLTNVLRHGRGAGARAVLTVRKGELGILVENVPGDSKKLAVQTMMGGGRGIAGMRERVGRIGGVLSAGPDGGGGFRVEARLPVPEGVRW